MYFLDANIFLELELDQKHADQCELLLRKVQRGLIKAVTTDFHIDTVLIVMENYGRSASEFRIFLSSVIGFEGLRIYFLSLADRLFYMKYIEELRLNYDDALAYQAIKRLSIESTISYDRHSDSLPGITRLDPESLV